MFCNPLFVAMAIQIDIGRYDKPGGHSNPGHNIPSGKHVYTGKY